METTAAPRNDLGLVGFILSLVGFLTGGLLSPVGLIISIVALGREPKGFAIAGLIIGLLGTCGGIIAFVIAGGAILAALGVAAVALALSQGEKIEITSDMAQVAAYVETYREENGRLPADLEEAGVPDELRTDPWGVGYRIDAVETPDADGPDFDVRSAGEDTIFDSEDDVTLLALNELWNASDGSFGVQTSADDGGTTIVRLGELRIEVRGKGENADVVIRSGDGDVVRVEDGKVQVGGDSSSSAPAAPSSPLAAPAPPPAGESGGDGESGG